MLVYSLSLSLSRITAQTAHKFGSDFHLDRFFCDGVCSRTLRFVKKEENGGKRNVFRLSPSELEPNSVKMGCGNTAKSLIITLHMAVFSTAFVTKLSAQ